MNSANISFSSLRDPPYSDEKGANADNGLLGFRAGDGTHAVSQRPPISLSKMEARTQGYTHDAKTRDLFIVQGHFLLPRAKPSV